MKQTVGDRVFKDSLVRGTGKCFTMLSTESARRKYRPLVMWACGRHLGYDTQIEGTRALFLYDLIGRYPSPEPFLDVVEERFFASFNKSDWLFQQECELLGLFGKAGNERARRILEQGYRRLLQYLRHLNPARVAKPYIPAPDNFESLCEQIMSCAKPAEVRPTLERVVRGVGELCMRDHFWTGTAHSVHLSLVSVFGEKRLAAMLGRIRASPEVEAYKAAVLQKKKEFEAEIAERKRRRVFGYREVYRRIKEQDTSGIRSILWSWERNGRTRDIEGLVRLYEKEEDTTTRARILDMFRGPKYKVYLPVDNVVRDASSEDDELRATALRALDGIKSPRVRDFALGMLKKRGITYETSCLIASNYRESDDDLLIAALKELGEMRRHHLGFGVLDYNVGGTRDRLSRRILMYLYNTTRCLACRERVVRELGRRHLLTDGMLAECLHDASIDIRVFAERLLSRRRAKVDLAMVDKKRGHEK